MLISKRTRHVIAFHSHNCQQHVINPLSKIVAPVIFTIILRSDFLDISGNCKLLRYVHIILLILKSKEKNPNLLCRISISLITCNHNNSTIDIHCNSSMLMINMLAIATTAANHVY